MTSDSWLRLLNALEKSSSKDQQQLRGDKDIRLEMAWTMASHSSLTPTPIWRGVREAKANERETIARHFEMRWQRTSPTPMTHFCFQAGEESGSAQVRQYRR